MTTTTDFPAAYMRLRTLLDALEVNTLRYCMDGNDRDLWISRIESVEAELLNMIGRVNGKAPCGPGYFNCGGVCVPYPCWEQAMKQTAE